MASRTPMPQYLAGRTNSRGPVAGVNGTEHLQLRINARPPARRHRAQPWSKRIRPGCGLDIARDGAVQRAIVGLGQEMIAEPAGAPADRFRNPPAPSGSGSAGERIAGRSRRQRAGVPLLGRDRGKEFDDPQADGRKVIRHGESIAQNRARNAPEIGRRNLLGRFAAMDELVGRALAPQAPDSLGTCASPGPANRLSRWPWGSRRSDDQGCRNFKDLCADREQWFLLLVAAARKAHQRRPGLAGPRPACRPGAGWIAPASMMSEGVADRSASNHSFEYSPGHHAAARSGD